MQLLETEYSAQDVAKAVGVSAKEIANWCDRGMIVGQRNQIGRGRKRVFSWFNLIEIAIAVELMKMGISSPGDAFGSTLTAAQEFAHTSGVEGRGGWYGDEPKPPRTSMRDPGLPFHYAKGHTYLFISGAKHATLPVRDGQFPLQKVDDALGFSSSLIMVNMSRLFAEIVGRMGLNHYALLNEAYGPSA